MEKETMKMICFAVVFLLATGSQLAQPSFKLGTDMDGFGYTDPIVQELKGTYNRWIKTANTTGDDFLFHADNFFNKWTASDVALNQEYSLVWGGGNFNPGTNGTLSNVTAGNSYTFKLRRNDANNNGYANLAAIVMATSSLPVNLDNRTQVPVENDVHQGQDVTVYLNLSAVPSSAEKFYLRYSTDNFATYGILEEPDSGAGTAEQIFTIPSQSQGTTVHYYLLSSTLSFGMLSGNEPLTDLATINFLRSAGTNNFQYTVLAPLPLQLVSFSATPKNNIILLEWISETELNFAGYEIQRRHNHGTGFEKIAWMGGRGSSEGRQFYQLEDNTALLGTEYHYRLKMLDLDGSIAYSPVRSAKLGGGWGEVVVFPNPTNGDCVLRFHAPFDGDGTIQVFDAMGIEVQNQPLPFFEGENVVPLDLENARQGIYRVAFLENGVAWWRGWVVKI